jgi:hypothetical protein
MHGPFSHRNSAYEHGFLSSSATTNHNSEKIFILKCRIWGKMIQSILKTTKEKFFKYANINSSLISFKLYVSLARMKESTSEVRVLRR